MDKTLTNWLKYGIVFGLLSAYGRLIEAGSSTTKEGETMNRPLRPLRPQIYHPIYPRQLTPIVRPQRPSEGIDAAVTLFVWLLVGFIVVLLHGCSYSTMQGRGYTYSGLGEKPIETATAYSIVTSADTQREVVHNQFAVQKQMFDACTKSGRTDCYLLLGGFGYYPGMVGSGGWWQPNEYQSDRTYYNR